MKLLTALTLLLALFFNQSAYAHKMKSTFTIVLFNERSGYLEVMHRLVLHDAEEAAWQKFGGKADIISDEETQAKLARYVTEQFLVKDQDNKPLNFDLVGFQNDAGYFWVYQDLPLPKDISKLKIKQQTFHEIWSEQINIVNIEGKGPVQSLTFTTQDSWQNAYFEKEKN